MENHSTATTAERRAEFERLINNLTENQLDGLIALMESLIAKPYQVRLAAYEIEKQKLIDENPDMPIDEFKKKLEELIARYKL